MTPDQDPRSESTASLFTSALNHISGLLRKEVDLARAEVNENLRSAAGGLGLIVGAIVFVLVSLNVLAGALVAWIAELGMHPGVAALLVGIAGLVVAFVLHRSGRAKLKLSSIAPSRTAENVQRDVNVIKEAGNV
ncbi:phage holin family protein [Celeribacter indicus]|uniref:Integral membrane protein n=1 Tax=Celeribacter indicus TaxID=1208324 RepID=A0A0B5E1C2_9RHOB|nr:phage holin family protein [Celeribacter indicus]AJE49079.1 hypothetical protein P73_4364 [Celeribacter indicus]SDW45348.1 Putative Holin-X, holin superfamily III [Celeribacter indicus]